MRICFVTHRYTPQTGGIETHVREVSERLVERGHKVVVLTADASQDLPAVEHRNGVEIHRYRSVSPGGAFYIAPGIARAVRHLDADVVHAHNYHALPVLFAALGVQDERFVVTPHYHGGTPSSFRDRLLSLYRTIGRWALRQADDIIAVSEWEREQLRSDFGIEATVIPNGIERERFSNAEPERRENPYLLCVGRLEEYKGIQYAIRALTALDKYDLVVAGSGPYQKELERIASNEGVADRVRFLGYVNENRLPKLYAGAEVFLNLSDFEAYGMTVAEALAAGTPCVVRKVGALDDWTEVSGCIGIAESNPDVVADAVRTVAECESTVRLPTWDDVVDKLCAQYSA